MVDAAEDARGNTIVYILCLIREKKTHRLVHMYGVKRVLRMLRQDQSLSHVYKYRQKGVQITAICWSRLYSI